MAGTAATLLLGVFLHTCMKVRLPLAVHQTLLSAEHCPILHGPLPSYENTCTDRGPCGSTSAVSSLKPTEFEIQ